MTQIIAQTSQNPFESYGAMHNDGCKRVLQSLSTVPAVGTCKPIVENVLRPVWGDSYFTNYASFPEVTSFEQLMAYFNARASSSFVNEVAGWNSFLATNPDYAAIAARVGQKETVVPQLVPQNEVNAYYIYLTTMKHSAKFWMPLSKGGENGASLGPGNGTGGTQGLSIWGWDAIGAGAGAIIGLGAGAIGGAVLASSAAWAFSNI